MMDAEYIKKLDFDSDTFQALKGDMNAVLQKMLGSMVEKESTEGSMNIKIDLTIVQEWIPNFNPEIDGETRMVRKPQFKHKVTSAIKIVDEKSGAINNEMEMVMDENGCYCLRPVADTEQRSIFDSDFQSGIGKPTDGIREEDIIDDEGGGRIGSTSFPALPDNSATDASESPDKADSGEGEFPFTQEDKNAPTGDNEIMHWPDDSDEDEDDDDSYYYDDPGWN